MSKSKPSPSEDPFATIPPRESFDAFPSLAAFPENSIAFLTGKSATPPAEIEPASQPASQKAAQPDSPTDTTPASRPDSRPAHPKASQKASPKASHTASTKPSQTSNQTTSLPQGPSLSRKEGQTPSLSSSQTLGRATVADRLNDNQRRVLDLLVAAKPYIIKFRDIADALGMREASVRTIMRRLDALGFLTFRKARDGNLQGVGVTFNQPVIEQYQQDQSAGPTPSLSINPKQSLSISQTPNLPLSLTQSQPIYGPLSQSASPSPPLEIEKKEILSIEALKGWDEAFLELMWPRVFAAGLRQEQLDQAAAARQKLGKALDRDLVALSLDRAEWELETQGKLVDLQSGEPVRSAAAYIYTALARWGVLRAHPQYVSREETEAEAAVAAMRRRQEALDTLENLRFEQYRAELTPQDLETILLGFPGGSKDAWIKAYWRKNVREAEAGPGPFGFPQGLTPRPV